MTVRPGAEAFHLEGTSRIAVLLVHGFTGSPASMRPWGAYLHGQGYTVACPRLPGHGTRWQDLAETTWQQWYAEVASLFDELRASHEQVFVAGLSMGGALSLRLAQEKGDAIAGLLLVNPAVCRPQRPDVPAVLAVDRIGLFGVVTKVVSTVPGIRNDIKKPGQDEIAYAEVPLRAALQLIRLQDSVRAGLGSVRQPLLLLHSPQDHVVEPRNSQAVLRDVASAQRTQVLLPDSYHVATLDNDAETIFAESLRFIRQHTVAPAAPAKAAPVKAAPAKAPAKRSAPRRRTATAGATSAATPKPAQESRLRRSVRRSR